MQLVMWRVKRGIFWVNGMEWDLKNLEEDWSREEEAGQGQIFPDLLGPAQTLDLHLETTPEKSLFQFPFFPCHIFWQFHKVNGHYRCTPFVSKTIARLVIQSCLALCNPVDCSLPGSSVHGISQAGILEWGANFFSRGSSQSRDRTCFSCVSCIVGGFLGEKNAKKISCCSFYIKP